MSWSYLVILVIITFSLLVTGIEHRSGMWPVLLATPHAKWKHFFMKVLTAAGFVQIFGLCVCLYLGGLGFIFGKSLLEYIKMSLELLYLPFLLAIPFVIIQTLISIVVESPYISVGIGMAAFLFHALLPHWWLPWGPLAYMQPSDRILENFPLLISVSLGYIMLSLLIFYRKIFSSGGE
ncbi:hypothetical protein [Bacillus halotolerans]|uniref:hypothetical protein n=1 Tax=Bacillus halotolerans TaxID=260554 RepID=UPI00187AB3E0|nr:hypothetical protein [Bacillus halotolerans]MEC1543702.1 hypothetical protein [Bacillus halotolerans]